MDDMLFRSRLNMPLVTGTPPVGYANPAKKTEEVSGESFQKVLTERLASRQSLAFSKHAAERIEERSIDVSDENLGRLQEGIALAQEKGLDQTLIIVDNSAFIVSVRNGTVVTALGGSDLAGSVITNISGTVIV